MNRTERLQIRYRNYRWTRPIGGDGVPWSHEGRPIAQGTPLPLNKERRAKYKKAREAYEKRVSLLWKETK